MSPESMAHFKNTLAARTQTRPNRGGGGRGGGGMRWGGWGGWGGWNYPYLSYYNYFPYTYAYTTPRTYFDGVNYWVWNGYQWVIYPTSYRYGAYVLGRSQNPSVGACTACGVTEEPPQAASPGPRFRPYFQGQQIPNPMQAYHYGRWGNNNAPRGLTMMRPMQAPARGTWLPALSNQLMPAPAGVEKWVVWPGGDYGLLHQAGIGITQMVSVIGSRAGGVTGLEVLVTQRILG